MNKPARVCIARHGETDWNAQGVLQGWIDVPLNASGRQQAANMARELAAMRFDAVWSSPLIRAHETARIVAAQLGLAPPRLHEGLRERNFGEIQGMLKSELAESNPLLLQHVLRRNPATRFAGGEKMEEFANRVIAAINDIGVQHNNGGILVITHGWAMDVIKRHDSGLPPDAILNGKPKNGEMLWLQGKEEPWQNREWMDGLPEAPAMLAKE